MTRISTGVISAGGVLDRIVEAKARRLESARDVPAFDHSTLKRARISLFDSLSRRDRTNIIAEIKRRSPSKGVLREDFDPASIAASYERSGAAAVSILTEEDFFDGSLDHLAAARSKIDMPILRKDFIFDSGQVCETADAGADALLLIVAILDDGLLKDLIDATYEARLDALVEVHTEREMERAARSGARVIGVNNRDLTTFKVTIETSILLAPLAPDGSVLVSESGIKTRRDIERLQEAGFDAFLIGEHFMRAPDPGQSLAKLVNS